MTCFQVRRVLNKFINIGQSTGNCNNYSLHHPDRFMNLTEFLWGIAFEKQHDPSNFYKSLNIFVIACYNKLFILLRNITFPFLC